MRRHHGRNDAHDKGAVGSTRERGVSRRELLKGAVGVVVATGASRFASAEDVPAEPDNLDEPTEWQEGDPPPQERQVPATEPEQTSQQAPPSQPMADNEGTPPTEDSQWVAGYWWWTNDEYVWVTGYWAVPPKPEYEYVPSYWIYQSNAWVYVPGGWGAANSTVVVQRAQPRPVLTALVITAPIRIVRRHRRWRHHHARHRAHTSRARHRHRHHHNKPGNKPGGPRRK